MTRRPTTLYRRGLAALEFVMVLPILVALLILIFYVGHAGSDQMELAKNLHYQAWRTRYDAQPGDVTPLSFVKIEQGEINGKDSGKVESKLIYDKWKHGTKSTAQFDANSWSRDSKWDDEAKYAVRAKDIKR